MFRNLVSFMILIVFMYSCTEDPIPGDDIIDNVEQFCGDGKINNDEQCDGNNLPAHQCTELGHYSGELSCKSDCTYDLSDCQYCGDGVIQKEQGEECDSDNLDGKNCSNYNSWGGPLQCDENCKMKTDNCDNILRIYQQDDNYRFDAVGDITIDNSDNLYVLGYTGSSLPGFQNGNPQCVQNHSN